MAAKKKKKSGVTAPGPKKRGVYADTGLTDKVADFSYENDALAQLIVDAWKDPALRDGLLADAPSSTVTIAQRLGNAKTQLENRGIYLAMPIVISEKEYEDGFSLEKNNIPNGVVFVLPNLGRATTSGPPLLETAKLLMGCTPNGI